MTAGRDLPRLLAVARGDRPADRVLAGGQVLSVFTREWLEADVALVDGVVAGVGEYDGAERIDVSGTYVVPGFIDAHMHFESTRLLPDEFAKRVLPQGTTTVVADPHEIANVLGPEGVRWFVDYCADLPLDVFFMAPSSVPASPLESPRQAMGPADISALLDLDRVLGVAEMMNFPGVIAGHEHELAKLHLAGSLHVDGHAPGVLGKELAAYAAAGIASDHEAYTVAEGRDRLQAGMWLLIREASPARNLDVLLPLLREFGAAARIAFCTDDREPEDLAPDGHINGMVRRAVAAGVPPEDAIAAATINAATCHRLRHLGAVAPGYQADLLVLDDLEGFVPRLVLKRGRPVDAPARPAIPAWVQESVRVQPIDRETLAIAAAGQIRVIGLIPEQIVTESLVMAPTVAEGHAVADPSRDLAKIAVIERHHATGRVGLGFVHGSCLQRGALASTVAHDAHNIVVIGMSDDDMLAAVNRLVELQGGIVAVDQGQVLAECVLPVAGLLSTAGAADVIAQSGACNEAAAALGWTGSAPFMTLSFLALSVIPALKITDHGLIDVLRGEVVAPTLDGAVRIVEFEPRLRDDFARLNIEWLERWFAVEPVDREVLGDPETHVLAGGGRILFAVDERYRALGTVALMRHEDGVVELTKMAVDPSARGAGIGRRLMTGALEAFGQMGGRELFLETNTKLVPALALYESVGFRRRPTTRPGSHYERANVYMVWEPPGS